MGMGNFIGAAFGFPTAIYTARFVRRNLTVEF